MLGFIINIYGPALATSGQGCRQHHAPVRATHNLYTGSAQHERPLLYRRWLGVGGYPRGLAACSGVGPGLVAALGGG